MKERILEFLRSENKSSAQLAEEIGVQPSGISHIISGRNKPSLDFILKMLEKYKYISTDWLLFGKGEMYKENRNQSLFDEPSSLIDGRNSGPSESSSTDRNIDIQDFKTKNIKPGTIQIPLSGNNRVIKIVWFYENNSFEEYLPRN
jgi:transcriptional regulator with XRE-family HTH domain